MNKKLLSVLSVVAVLNTACSPKQQETTSSTAQSSSLSSAATVAPTPAPTTASAEAINIPSSELLNTYWKLILLNDAGVVAHENQREPHIVLNAENRVAGSDGCNSLSGGYTLAGEKLAFGPLAGTRMACPQGAEQSQAFNEILSKVAAYSQHSDQLELRDATGRVIARFKAAAQP